MNKTVDFSQTDLLVSIINEANEIVKNNDKITPNIHKDSPQEIITIFDIVGLIVNDIDHLNIEE